MKNTKPAMGRLVVIRKFSLPPIGSDHYCLLKDGLSGFLLLIGRVTVLAEDAFNYDAQPDTGSIKEAFFGGSMDHSAFNKHSIIDI